jgi:hypothetical protein
LRRCACSRQTAGLEIHCQQLGVVWVGLEGDSAAEAAAVRRIIRLRADIGTDVDEYCVGCDSAGCCKECDGALDLAPLPAAALHQPGADHAVSGIDKEARIVGLAGYQMAAHDDVAQCRLPDQ